MKQQPLRIRQIRLLVAPNDLIVFASQFVNLDRFVGLEVTAAESTLRVVGRYRLALFHVPVDLTFRVAGVRPDALDLSLTAGRQSEGALIYDMLAGVVQGAGLDGIVMQGNHLLIDTRRMGAMLGTTFRLRSVAFSPAGILVEADDFLLFNGKRQE